MATKKTAQREASAQRIAAARAQSAAAERKKRVRNATAITTAVVVVLAGVITLAITQKPKKSNNAAAVTASADVLKAVDTVSPATSVIVGDGKTTSNLTAITAPALTANGLPRVFYVGAEYCPYCAAERWPMTIALERFGSFTNLGETTSSSIDTFPNTPTLSFHGATYTSKYISFTGVEQETNQSDGKGGYTNLDNVTPADDKILNTYNATPYLPESSAGAIPFIDFGGKYLLSGASYSPQLLAGKTQADVAVALQTPTDPITASIIGTANRITAAICQLTKQAPASVCKAAPIPTLTAALPTPTS